MEEERLLRRAIEESKAMAGGGSQSQGPDVDNMTYEQLMDLGEKTGNVSKGCTQAQINSIKALTWVPGKSKSDECLICMEKFKRGDKFKKTRCGHEYHAECLDKWLANEKRCPVSN